MRVSTNVIGLCNTGWSYHQCHCYQVFSGSELDLDYWDAQNMCINQAGTLAWFPTAETFHFLADLIRRSAGIGTRVRNML